MCGIAGFVQDVLPPGPVEIGRHMAALLSHRGPDASGAVTLDGAGVFAHARLAVIDLSERAAQPFVRAQLSLVHNGEVYNFQELRRVLEAEGSAFSSSSDTEVILEQYRRFGTAGLDALDGMFAFGLYDREARRLILMRDRIGKKPLYYVELEAGLVFASEIKALRAHPGVELGVDESLIPEYLSFGYVGTPRSLYRGVKTLEPGTRLILERGRSLRVERYHDFARALSTPMDLGFSAAKSMVREAVSGAVRSRLVSDVPLGAFLSGGIDSSIVVCEMAKASSERVRTFSVSFSEDATFDEARYAREVAARFDTEHTEIVVSAAPADQIESLVRSHDQPFGDSSAVAVYAVARATRAHVSVVLTGDGGDEAFGGYTRFRGGLVDERVPQALKIGASKLLARLPRPRGYKDPLALLQRFVENAERSPDEQLLSWNTYFAGPALSRVLRKDVFPPSDPWQLMSEQLAVLERAARLGADRLGQILFHNLRTYLLDDLLVKTDRMTMAVGLEARSPFLDTKLLELALRLPSRYKLSLGRLKWILREAYRDELPPSVLDRRKHGFGVPVSKWWSGRLAPMVDDLLVADGARCHAYVHAAELRRLVDAHRSGQEDHGQRIFALLTLELWLRGFSQSRS